MRVPKLPKLGLPRLWGPITSCENLVLRWGLKQSCSLCRDLSNGMLHATYTQVNQVDSWLLMVKSQTTNLTPDLLLAISCVSDVQMGHASPFQTSTFQYLFNDINNSLVHWVLTPAIALWTFRSPQDSNSQCGSSLGSVRAYSLTLSCTPGSMRHDSQASLLARNLATPYLGRKPKAKVVTSFVMEKINVMQWLKTWTLKVLVRCLSLHTCNHAFMD